MEFQHIKGNTYALEVNGAAIGVYVFGDHRCLLVDSGPSPTWGKEILANLDRQGWRVYAIFNTHGHADHCGGNHFIQDRTDCRIFAATFEAALIQQPILIPYSMYGAFPPKLLQAKFVMPQASKVTDLVSEGSLTIKGQRFEVLELGGHTLGHTGIRTPDRVLFTGDSLIAPEMLDLNPFLYLADPGRHLATLEKIRAGNYRLLYLSHGGMQEDAPAMAEANRAMLMHILDVLMSLLRAPLSHEEITAAMIARQHLQVNRNHYFRISASIAAFLAYLSNQGQIKSYTDNGRLLYHV
jgi:glyoxylase-like metal-dependent hydrolase (beta-lactamase superfamily II)